MTTSAGLPAVGPRIREARQRRGIALRGLAREVGVSASLISQIETGKSSPSVSTLYAITKVLGISVEDVFDAEVAEVGMHATSAVSTEPPAAPPLAHPGEREILELDSGVTWERLGRVPGSASDFLRVTYAPGGCSSSTGQLMRHSGVEYGYLLEGELRLTLAFEEHLLRPGDSVAFPSTTPHRYRNEGARPAVGIFFVEDKLNEWG